MLVLLGPSFDGSSSGLAKLAEVTGLVAYELRARIKPGCWGVIRALADPEQAHDLAARLQREGFPVVAVTLEQAWSPERRFVKAQAVRLEPEALLLRVREREMVLPYAAVLVIVRGEAGADSRPPRSLGVSSATLRAVGLGDAAARRDTTGRSTDAFQAADLHFHTARWVARVDPRVTDLSQIDGATGVTLPDLELLAGELGRRTGARVDRGSRMSSLASYAMQGHRAPPPTAALGAEPLPDRFDGYSRLVGEAELAAHRARAR